MIKKVSAIYCLFIGISMLGLWCMLLLSGGVPELKTEPIRIALHIVSEILTAILMLAAGISLLRKSRIGKSLFLVANGAVLYSVLNAAGYYGQLGNMAMIVMFSVIFAASTVLVLLSRDL